jgi:hypothetical protein
MSRPFDRVCKTLKVHEFRTYAQQQRQRVRFARLCTFPNLLEHSGIEHSNCAFESYPTGTITDTDLPDCYQSLKPKRRFET